MDFPPDQDPGNIRFLPPAATVIVTFFTRTQKNNHFCVTLYCCWVILIPFLIGFIYLKVVVVLTAFIVFCPAGFSLIYVCDGFAINSLFHLKFENKM